MSGDVIKIPVAASGDLPGRVAALEGRVTAIEGGVAIAVKASQAAQASAQEAADGVREIAGLIRNTKGVAAFLNKHWPRAVAFGTGICITAGWGNPKVMHFIASFFGV